MGVAILMQDIKKGGATIDTLVGDLKPALQYCGVMKDDVVAELDVLKDCCKNPADLVKHIKANLNADDAGFIASELEKGVHDVNKKASDMGGGHFGKAMHRALFGPVNKTLVV